MENSIYIKLTAIVGCLLGAVLLSGCSGGSEKPEVVSAGAAPAPSNLTPEQKKAYEDAVKKTQPPAK